MDRRAAPWCHEEPLPAPGGVDGQTDRRGQAGGEGVVVGLWGGTERADISRESTTAHRSHSPQPPGTGGHHYSISPGCYRPWGQDGWGAQGQAVQPLQGTGGCEVSGDPSPPQASVGGNVTAECQGPSSPPLGHSRAQPHLSLGRAGGHECADGPWLTTSCGGAWGQRGLWLPHGG